MAFLLLWWALGGGSGPVLAGPRSVAPPAPAALKNLTREQQTRLNEIYHRYHPKKMALTRKVKTLRKQVVGLIQAENPDQGAIKQLLATIFNLESRRQQLVIDEYFEVMNVLRPEQRRSYRDELVEHLSQER